MNISAIPAGKNIPDNINVIIEIPQGSGAIKYEVDKDSGAVMVDRFLGTSMVYPANYGFVPNTLADDGDPLDVLVYTHTPIALGAVIAARPLGVLMMEDEGGMDEKIVAVPVSKLASVYDNYQSPHDLPIVHQIKHFFEHYKDLEAGKWVKVTGWEDHNIAKQRIEHAVQQAKNSGDKLD
jgi:inorganic pyrophosphatase